MKNVKVEIKGSVISITDPYDDKVSNIYVVNALNTVVYVAVTPDRDETCNTLAEALRVVRARIGSTYYLDVIKQLNAMM